MAIKKNKPAYGVEFYNLKLQIQFLWRLGKNYETRIGVDLETGKFLNVKKSTQIMNEICITNIL